tara:strand:- start:4401 stop:5672 length:1272 start_codon:yes stop_codon:yes gene_type:complete
MKDLEKIKIAVIGLGYVGLPLAVEFSKKKEVIGFDVNKKRIAELKEGFDKTGELSNDDILSQNIEFTSNVDELSESNFYIVTVPTPVDDKNIPDLSMLESASKLVGKVLTKDNIVVYESTVYPGATEEICVPILERESNLIFNEDFFCGYSPERINPGDKKNKLPNITKITSGSTEESAIFINQLYSEIISAGTHMTNSIIEAEAAKVIENTQRDINIALMNELSIIFRKMNIDTEAVLEASRTKWNFLDFKPGLVGGHCIGVDPYYLTYKSEIVGHKSQIILAGRGLNDGMSKYIYDEFKVLLKSKIKNKNPKILVMGVTFKENCPDIRNSKIFDIINLLKEDKYNIDLYDSLADKDDVEKKSGIRPIDLLKKDFYDVIFLAVPHTEFLEMGYEKIKSLLKTENVFLDLKSCFDKEHSDYRM